MILHLEILSFNNRHHYPFIIDLLYEKPTRTYR